MDPTEHDAVARPVPRAWLDPHIVDAARLDRLLADRDLVERLAGAGYAGWDWDHRHREGVMFHLRAGAAPMGPGPEGARDE